MWSPYQNQVWLPTELCLNEVNLRFKTSSDLEFSFSNLGSDLIFSFSNPGSDLEFSFSNPGSDLTFSFSNPGSNLEFSFSNSVLFEFQVRNKPGIEELNSRFTLKSPILDLYLGAVLVDFLTASFYLKYLVCFCSGQNAFYILNFYGLKGIWG